jgi:hypothetical protein
MLLLLLYNNSFINILLIKITLKKSDFYSSHLIYLQPKCKKSKIF